MYGDRERGREGEEREGEMNEGREGSREGEEREGGGEGGRERSSCTNCMNLLYYTNCMVISSDWLDDVELVSVRSCSGLHCSVVRWFSICALSKCHMGLCGSVRVSW